MNLRYTIPAVFACGFAISLLATVSAEAGSLSVELEQAIVDRAPGDFVDVIVKCADRADIRNIRDRDLRTRRTRIVRAYRQAAAACERLLTARLRSAGGVNTRTLALANGVAVRVPVSSLIGLTRVPGVDKVVLDRIVPLPEAVPAGIEGGPAIPEWNIDAIQAPVLWDLGFDGQGVVVATMDSGVDEYHPDIGPQRRLQNSWFDPNGEHATPYDASGHGTWAMGLILGGNAGGTVIGVAPEAQWIAVKIFDDSGGAPLSSIHAGFDWLLDPDGNPATDDAPDIVNNSWYLDATQGACNQEFAADIAALKAAEIAVVFSAGNTGPSPGSSVSPPNDPIAGSVGAVDFSDNVASFSARGPSACDGGIFPDVVAPGYQVRTADLTLGGVFPYSYVPVTGTSFASPHVSGAMALLKNGFPDATVSELESALTESAVDIGVVGPDNDAGAGRIDVAEAYNWLVASRGSPEQGELRFSADTYSTDENVATLTVTVSRLYGSTGDVTVDYATLDGTAVAGDDYQASSGTLTFLEGETSQTFSVTILDDTVTEGDEDFTVSLSNPTGGAVLGTPNVGTATIVDDESAGPPDDDGDGYAADVDCNDNDPTIYPGAPEAKHDGVDQDCNGYDLTIDITRARYIEDQDKLVVWATSNLGDQAALQVTADNADASSVTLNMNWNAGKSRWNRARMDYQVLYGSPPVSVTVFGVEGSESATVEPIRAPGELHLDGPGYTVDEAAGTVTVTVTRILGTAGGVTIDYATADGSATAGADYVAASGTLTFAEGDTSQTFAVTVLDDALYEGDEDFAVSLSNPTGGAALGTPDTAMATIVEDDPQSQPGDLQLSAASYSVDENGGSVTVTVTRTNGSAGDVTVDYATADGSAIAGEDYATASGTLTLLDGETSGTFSVTLIDDGTYEGDEDFTVSLSNPTGGAALGMPDSATVTIVEDDTSGPVDDDGDGFAVDVDCNDSDPTVHPGAPEIKHDGTDQDCNGYDLTIDITRAWYIQSQDKLVVWATSDLGNLAALQVTADNADASSVTLSLNWNASKLRWQRARKNYQALYGSPPVSVTVFGVEGSESVTVEPRP